MQETTDYKKSVIMGLIRGHKDLKKYDDNVIKRNTLIHNNFNVRYNYPLVTVSYTHLTLPTKA